MGSALAGMTGGIAVQAVRKTVTGGRSAGRPDRGPGLTRVLEDLRVKAPVAAVVNAASLRVAARVATVAAAAVAEISAAVRAVKVADTARVAALRVLPKADKVAAATAGRRTADLTTALIIR